MKRNLLLIFSVLTFIGNAFAQFPMVKQWDKRFGGNDEDHLQIILQTNDNGFILGGYSLSDSSGDKTQSNCATSPDLWLVKIDVNGNKQWDKTYGGFGYDWLFGLEQTSDGGYVFGGRSNSDSSCDWSQHSRGVWDYWFLKVDSNGNKLWDKRFGGNYDDWQYALAKTSNNGFILGGWSDSDSIGDKTQQPYGNHSFDFWIVVTDSQGNKLWDKRYGNINTEGLFSLQETKDKGFILGGNSSSNSGNDKSQPNWDTTLMSSDYWIIKIDSLGNKQWDKRFGGTLEENLKTVRQTTDGGYILGGWSLSDSTGDKTQNNWDTTGASNSYDYWIVKTDSIGNKQWDRRYGGTNVEDEFGNISQTTDGGYLMSGSSYSNISGDKTENNMGQEQLWIVKIDSVGNKQWDKTIFTPSHDEGAYAIQTNDGCYVFGNYSNAAIGGYKSQSSWNNSLDCWIVKFCDTTSTTSLNQLSNLESLFTIYPNPTNTELNFVLNQRENIIITNVLGEIVLQKTLMGKVELDVSSLSAGIYFIKAGSGVRKFVKE